MKLVNFASLDPAQKKRNIKGLSNASRADQEIWDEFHSSWERLALESEARIETLGIGPTIHAPAQYSGKTETVAQRRVRLAQGFFRGAVLSSYDGLCAVCSLGLSELLIASHIVPWSVDVSLRVDPTNGLSLCAFHDRAFDAGLFTLDEGYSIILSKRARHKPIVGLQKPGLLDMAGQQIRLPSRFRPALKSLAHHREQIFLG